MAERRHALLVGVALLFGLSPSLLVAMRQLTAEPRLYYVIAMVALLVQLAMTAPRDPDVRLSSALPWVLAAILIQILTTAGGFPHFSRFAVPFGMVAFLRICGTPLRVSLVSFLCVPPPHMITGYFGLPYAQLWADLAARVSPRDVGELVAWDAGLRFVALGTGVTTYRCLKARLTVRQALLPLLATLVLAVPLQVLTIALAGWSPAAASETLLIHGGSVVALIAFLFVPLPRLPALGVLRSVSAHAL